MFFNVLSLLEHIHMCTQESTHAIWVPTGTIHATYSPRPFILYGSVAHILDDILLQSKAIFTSWQCSTPAE